MSETRSGALSRLDRARITFRRFLTESYSPGAFLFVSVVALGLLLLMTALILTHYFGKDVVTSLTQLPDDDFACTPQFDGLGVHCFGDYALVRELVLSPNPWASYKGLMFNYPAAGTLTHLPFALISAAVGSTRVGLALYMAALLVAVAIPAWWASAGKPVATRILAVGLFGVVSAPALMVLDRGNSIGFIAPVLLLLFVGLRRGNSVAIVAGIVLATMIKPQFILLLIVLIAARKWKLTGITLAGIGITNLIPYVFWPTEFPSTIFQSLKNILGYGGGVSLFDEFPANVSFAKSLHLLELGFRQLVGLETNHTWVNGHQNLVGAIIVGVIVVAIAVLGRRLPMWLTAVILAASASMFPGLTWSYYLVFALPVAAVILRDPAQQELTRDEWHGVLEDWSDGRLKRIAAVALVVAIALTVSRVVIGSTASILGQSTSNLVKTSAEIAPLLWIIAIALATIALAVTRTPSGSGTTESAEPR